LKIVFLTPLYEPWGIGGGEKYAYLTTNELARENEVVIITTKGPKPRNESKKINPRIIEINTNISSFYEMASSANIGTIKKSLWHFFDIWNISSYKKIKKILISEKPNLVHTNGIKGFSSSLFSVINELQIPHVHTLHDYELISRWVGLFRKGKPISNFNVLEKLYLMYSRNMSSKINAVISPSKFVMNFHTKFGFFKNSSKYIIPNGIQIDSSYNPKTENSNEFIFVGQILENKGAHIAIQAFKKIRDTKAQLHIVGTGPFIENLKQIAGIENNIILHGYLEEKKLNSLLERCSYFIMPSLWYENFPLVINEVMSKGLPVIASDIGGISEIVEDGKNGFLFKPGDVDSLVAIIQNIINGKYDIHKFSENALKSSRKFTMEDQMKSIKEIYSKIGC